jgi:hypothetical protein
LHRADRREVRAGDADERQQALPTKCPGRSAFRMLARRVACGYKVASRPEAGGLPKNQCQFYKALILLGNSIGEWCNGSTTDSDSVCLGSNPGSPAILSEPTNRLMRTGFSPQSMDRQADLGPHWWTMQLTYNSAQDRALAIPTTLTPPSAYPSLRETEHALSF